MALLNRHSTKFATTTKIDTIFSSRYCLVGTAYILMNMSFDSKILQREKVKKKSQNKSPRDLLPIILLIVWQILTEMPERKSLIE